MYWYIGNDQNYNDDDNICICLDFYTYITVRLSWAYTSVVRAVCLEK